MEKNGTPASPATARASRVLPVPGGPYSSTPFGILAPTAWNLPGSDRNSRISCSSSTASATPATSANVTCGFSLLTIFALDLPKRIIPAPPCMREDSHQNSASSRNSGSMKDSSEARNEVCGTTEL